MKSVSLFAIYGYGKKAQKCCDMCKIYKEKVEKTEGDKNKYAKILKITQKKSKFL